MTFNVCYTYNKVITSYEKENGETVKRHRMITNFEHESFDEDDILAILAEKFRNENFSCDDAVTVECEFE